MDKKRIIIGAGIVVALLLGYTLFFKKDEVKENGEVKKEKPTEEVIKISDTEINDYHLVENDNVVISQNISNKELGKEIDIESKEGLDNARIIIDPYKVSPLTALIVFNSEKESTIKMTIKGKNNNDLIKEFPSSTKHVIPVYGLYNNYNNKVIIEDEFHNKKEFIIPIKDALKEKFSDRNLDKLEVIANNIKDRDEFYFVTSPIDQISLAYDTYGELRWLLLSGSYKEIEQLSDGSLLLSGKGTINESIYNTDLVNIDMFGKVIQYYYLPNGFHNDYVLLDDSKALVVSNAEYYDNAGDSVLQINLKTGKVDNTWNIKKILSKVDSSFMENLGKEWDFNSGIDYDENTNSIILSYWIHGTVISIDYESGKINWMFGNPSLWSSNFANYFLTVKGNDNKYPLSIQAAKVDGDILSMFDNGYDLITDDDRCSSIKNNRSSIVDYKINTSKKTATLSKIRLQDQNLFSYALGDYDKKYDNELVVFGRELKNPNYDDESCQLYTYPNWQSYIFEIKDDNILYKAKADLALYRVSLINPYKVVKTYEISNGTINKSVGINMENDIDTKTLNRIKNESIISDLAYTVSINSNIMNINALFSIPDEVNVYFVDSYGQGKKYGYKVSGINDTERVVLILPSERYYIYIEVNGVIYNTRQYIDL